MSGGFAASPSLGVPEYLPPHIHELRCMAAGLSSLIYCYNLIGLQRILECDGATHFKGFNPKWENSYSRGIWDNSKIALGFVMEGRAWLVIRGSDDTLDWDTNFQYSKTEDGIHHGFWRAWNGFSKLIYDWVDVVAEFVPSVVITGHSLGGAIGVLAARSISEKTNIGIEHVFTFGAPRVGSKKFVVDYNTRLSNRDGLNGPIVLGDVTWQTRIKEDIVPKVCPRWLGFAHCGKDAEDLPPARDMITHADNEHYPVLLTTSSGILDSLINAFSDLTVLLKPFFSAAETVKQSGLSHRMTGYQDLFGKDLPFNRAIARHDDVVNAIQDSHFDVPSAFTIPPIPRVTIGPSISTRNEFIVEKTYGWTPRLSIATAVAINLLIAFFLGMIWSVVFLAPSIRVFGYILIVLFTFSFVRKLVQELTGSTTELPVIAASVFIVLVASILGLIWLVGFLPQYTRLYVLIFAYVLTVWIAVTIIKRLATH